ncbi:oligosaccharide flippase family protein, partial [candidate division KSB1 bacterium]|nr:oligosaccharide flippase family protein [candidate division KSB1 bacterium]
MSESLAPQIIRGIKWSYLSTIINSAVQLIYTALMARLLFPSDFGLMAMANAIVRFGLYFSQIGIGPALIQKKELSQNEIQTGYTVSIFLGISFFCVFYFSAPLSEFIFHSEKVENIIQI